MEINKDSLIEMYQCFDGHGKVYYVPYVNGERITNDIREDSDNLNDELKLRAPGVAFLA